MLNEAGEPPASESPGRAAVVERPVRVSPAPNSGSQVVPDAEVKRESHRVLEAVWTSASATVLRVLAG